eukprot:symbB.v1.2.005222.t1/scaffold293.1/size237565/3
MLRKKSYLSLYLYTSPFACFLPCTSWSTKAAPGDLAHLRLFVAQRFLEAIVGSLCSSGSLPSESAGGRTERQFTIFTSACQPRDAASCGAGMRCTPHV